MRKSYEVYRWILTVLILSYCVNRFVPFYLSTFISKIHVIQFGLYENVLNKNVTFYPGSYHDIIISEFFRSKLSKIIIYRSFFPFWHCIFYWVWSYFPDHHTVDVWFVITNLWNWWSSTHNITSIFVRI